MPVSQERPNDRAENPATEDRDRIAEASLDDNSLVLLWGDGHKSLFHRLWLYHSPGCKGGRGAKGRFPGFGGRSPQFDKVSLTNQGTVKLHWKGQSAVSEFDAKWLRDNCYSTEERNQRRRKTSAWPSNHNADWARCSLASLESEEGLLQAYERLLDFGFLRMEGLPDRSGAVLDLAQLFGLVSSSNYADDPALPTLERIRINPAVPVNTRKSDFLGPHSDTCWRSSLSGLVFMHCLEADVEGGESLLVDGFALAERLREAAPDAFYWLAKTTINFAAKVPNGDDWRALGRVFRLDQDGRVAGIRYAGDAIFQLDLPAEKIGPTYEALETLDHFLYDQDHWLTFKLNPGEALVIDNQRVLHGRQAFDANSGTRCLETCSSRRDEFHYRYRHLAKRLGRPDWSQDQVWGLT